MSDQNEGSLLARIERLEREVAEIRRHLEQISRMITVKDARVSVQPPPTVHPSRPDLSKKIPTGAPSAPGVPIRLPPPAKKKRDISRELMRGEFWFNKIGIGLLLFAVVFLFKYSIDQGWLTPPVRVGCGLIVGIALLVMGILLYKKRRHFSQVLLGGGIAAFYITGFAAFQLYHLVSFALAMIFMTVITILAFFLSLKQGGAVLSIIGALGGLGTPFLLYTGSANLPGLVGYTCLILAGTSALYFLRAWRSLLWTSAIGGWIVFLTGIVSPVPRLPVSDCWFLQLGLIFGMLVFWALPLVREILLLKDPERWPRPSLTFLPESIARDITSIADQTVHLLSIITPIVTLILSRLLWTLSGTIWGLITIVGAIVYGIVSWRLKQHEVNKPLAYTHMLMALALLTIALCLMLKGDLLFFALAVEAFILHIISRQLSDRNLLICSHALFGALWLWLLYRLTILPAEEIAIFNSQALTELFVIVAGVVITRIFQSALERQAYQVIAHILLLGWFLREFSALANGQAYVTISWGLYGIVLLIAGLRLRQNQIRIAAMVTLIIVVAKLFLVDLTMLKAIWRILLFMGFGIIFLVISYYFQALWRGPSNESGESKET